MHIGLFAYDVGPGAMLRMIAETAKKRGHTVTIAPPQRPAASENGGEYTLLVPELASCDVLIIGGPASYQPEEEARLLKSLPDKPFFVVEDMPGTSLRPKFPHELVERSAGVFLAMPQWARQVEEAGYSQVEYIGPPPHWGSLFETITGPSIRDQLYKTMLTEDGGTHSEPVWSDDKILFFCGTKDSIVNNEVLARLCAAGKNLLRREQFVLGFKPHPGERPKEPAQNASHEEWDVYWQRQSAYVHACDDRQKILSGAVWHLDFRTVRVRNDLLLATLIKSVDVPVVTGGTTNSIAAAYARIAVGYYDAGSVVEYNQKHGMSDGRLFFVAELGGVLVLDGREQGRFEEGIQSLLSEEGRAKLRETQEKNFPLPETWDTAPLIIERIEEDMRQKHVT